MSIPYLILISMLSCIGVMSCTAQLGDSQSQPAIPAAEYPELYLDRLEGKRVGLTVNHTSVVGDQHIVDYLLGQGMEIARVFAPEHGFRGTASAGESVADDVDARTRVKIVSLYGSKKKPSSDDLHEIDIMVFDIQDMGVRFYTYISTLHYVMEACAEQGIPVVVLDRPNPHDHYIDGPLLDPDYKSFVGMHPVPIVYGMTIGEYARMILGQSWLDTDNVCDLTVVPCQGYRRSDTYSPPIAPSPNLPTERSMLLYPSLCLFEGTTVSVGRGTDTPFEVLGHPELLTSSFVFTPRSVSAAPHPKWQGQTCHGLNLASVPIDTLQRREVLDLSYLLLLAEALGSESDFFLPNLFFDKLTGSKALRLQIIAGKEESEIRASWQEDLEAFAKIRSQYLLYED